MLDELLSRLAAGRAFISCTIDVDEATAATFLKMRRSPQRFTPSCFEGDWAEPDSHPPAGELRLVAAVRNDDGDHVHIVGRHGKSLYATTREMP
jgi:hypothetical protein